MNPSDTIGITDFIVLVYTFLKRNLVLISSITVLGFFIGLAYSMQKPKYYTTELVGFTDIIEQTTLLEILGPLTKLTDEKNYDELSSKLSITVAQASQIRELVFSTSRHTKTSHAPQATDKKLGELIVIKATTYDQEILENLEKGLISFLEHNEYLKSSNNLAIQKTNNLISEVSKNLDLVDSLYRSNDPKMSSSMVSIRGEANPANYYHTVTNLENLKIRQKVIQPFTVVSSFYKVNKPSNDSMLIITAATVAFIILSLLIVFVRELHHLASK